MGRAGRKTVGGSNTRKVEIPGARAESPPESVVQVDQETLLAEPVRDTGQDVQEAAELIASGKPVRLQQDRGPSAHIEAVLEGKTALADIYEPGSNLFAELGRHPLRGAAQEDSWAWVNASPDSEGVFDLSEWFFVRLQREGYPLDNDRVPVGNIRASQDLQDGGNPENPFIVVSEDDYIVLGNDDWAASVRAGAETIPVQRLRGLSVSQFWSLALDYARGRGIIPAEEDL